MCNVRKHVSLVYQFLVFTVRICNDVLDDVLHYGIRTELITLQLIGKRFDCIIQTRFPEKPFHSVCIKFLVCCVIQTISLLKFSSNFVDVLQKNVNFSCMTRIGLREREGENVTKVRKTQKTSIDSDLC